MLFRLTLTGQLTTLYAFTGYDGALFWNLVEAPNNQLYVVGGQAGGSGNGVVDEFAMQPASPTMEFYFAPRVVKLTVTNQTMAYWTTTDATACTSTWSTSPFNEGPETVSVSSPGTFTYTLTCSGANGSVTKTSTVTITAN